MPFISKLGKKSSRGFKGLQLPVEYSPANSQRFRASAQTYLTRTPTVDGNRKIFTYSAWMKRGILGVDNLFFSCSAGSNANKNELMFTGDQLRLETIVSGVSNSVTTQQVFRDVASWYHIVLSVDTTQATPADRVRMYVNGVQVTQFASANYPTQNADLFYNSTNQHLIGAGNQFAGLVYYDGYMADICFVDGLQLAPTQFGRISATTGTWVPIMYRGSYGQNGFCLLFPSVPEPTPAPITVLQYSARFRSSASAYLNRTPTVAGNRKAWTISMWFKLGSLTTRQQLFGTTGSATQAAIVIEPTGTILAFTGNASQTLLRTNQVLRDPAAWYHIVWAENTTDGTPSNRSKLYLNGVQITSFLNAQYPALDYEGDINSTIPHYIGSQDSGVTDLLDGYLAEINFVNATNYTASAFGFFDANGIWQPQAFTGTFGTNGFNLRFLDPAAVADFGRDFSANNNTWTVNNLSLTTGATYDAMADGPSVNYATLNAIIRQYSSVDFVSDGGLKYTVGANGGATDTAVATIPMTSGKWFAEVTINAAVTSQWVGVCSNLAIAGLGTLGSSGVRNPGYAYKVNTGNKCNNDNNGTAYAVASTTGDVIGIAMDADTNSITFYKNGTSLGEAFTGMTSVGGFVFGSDSDPNGSFTWNFGQQPWRFTPPSGFNALNTANLPTPTIVQPNTQMDVAVWTGVNTANAITISSLQFQPDVVWGKTRSIAYTHGLHDSNRGISAGRLRTNDTTAEVAPSAFPFGSVTAFNANGFTTSPGSTDNENWNTAGATYVAWCWRAGGAAVTNSVGTITSQVSANPTAGFSVVTYTGSGTSATIGHGIGSIPQMIIIKARTSATNWRVYAQPLGITGYLNLNTTDAVQTASIWGAPTATGFVIGGTGYEVNESGVNYVAYCFAPIASYSAFGSYAGNGSTDGPFIYTGFRPKFLLMKRSDSAGDWYIYDTARNTFNESKFYLVPDSSDAETSNLPGFDLLSNGFKLRTSINSQNQSGGTYIYLAFAESPFKFARAR